MHSDRSFLHLQNNIVQFRKRLFLERLLRGTLKFGIVLVILFTVYSLIGYRLDSPVWRLTLLISNLSITLLGFFYWMGMPLIAYLLKSRQMSIEKTSQIIGNHIEGISDRLLNTLQLEQMLFMQPNNVLVSQGLEQRLQSFEGYDFSKAIEFKKIGYFLKISLLLYTLFLISFLLWPDVYVLGTKKIVFYNREFPKPLPFGIQILSNPLECQNNTNFLLQIKTQGAVMPSDLTIDVDGVFHRMQRLNSDTFQFIFSDVQQNKMFRFRYADRSSESFELRVLPRPQFKTINIRISPPRYTHLPQYDMEYSNSVVVPQGSQMEWFINIENTSHCQVYNGQSLRQITPDAAHNFTFSEYVLNPFTMAIRLNALYKSVHADSVNMQVQVLADQSPALTIESEQDSLHPGQIYVNGVYTDDYGFSDLKLSVMYAAHPKTDFKLKTQQLAFNASKGQHVFYHHVDLSTYDLKPGSRIQYYFSVSDNDAVNGPKTVTSNTFEYVIPTINDILKQERQIQQQTDNSFNQGIQQAQNIKREIETLKREMAQKQQFDAQDQKRVQNILEQFNQLEQQVKSVQDQQRQQTERNSLADDQTLIERQKEIETLLEQILTPELKKMIEEIKALMKQQNREAVAEKLDELKLKQDELQNELDLQRDQLKALQLDQQYEQIRDQLKQFESELRSLAEQTQKSNPESKEALKQQHQNIQNQIQDALKELNRIKDENNMLPQPMDVPETSKSEHAIKQSMNQAQKDLQHGDTKGASQQQNQAADEMSEMQKTMDEAASTADENQQEINIQQLREIMDALLQASFRQEKIMEQSKTLDPAQPSYNEVIRLQSQLRGEVKNASDSLYALSRKAPQIAPQLRKHLNGIQKYILQSVTKLVDREPNHARLYMQSAMTDLNAITVLLQESLEAMQQQMRQQMQSKSSKNGACKKPGKSKGKNPGSTGQLGQARKLQEQLNEQMRQLKEQMGKQQGGQKGTSQQQDPSSKKGQGQGGVGSSEQFARMAAQQEVIRRQLEEALRRMKQHSGNAGQDLSQLMEQTERELVHKQLSPELLRRQQEIVTRLLEQEQAEREQDEDFKRESQYLDSEQNRNLKPFLEYKRRKASEWEPILELPIDLTPYYQQRLLQLKVQ